jgi:hypothetical protein
LALVALWDADEFDWSLYPFVVGLTLLFAGVGLEIILVRLSSSLRSSSVHFPAASQSPILLLGVLLHSRQGFVKRLRPLMTTEPMRRG